MSNTINEVFTRTMAATDVITISSSAGLQYISVLCKTDNSGSNGITISGEGRIGSTASNNIVLKENESIAITAPGGGNIGNLTITAGTSSTGIVVAQ